MSKPNYRAYCRTVKRYKVFYSASTPTQCPDGHDLDPARVFSIPNIDDIFIDEYTEIQNQTDTTKVLQLDLSNLTPSTTRILDAVKKSIKKQ